MENEKKYKLFLLVSIVVYLIALTQKSFCTPGQCENFSGFLNLIFGWIGVLMLHLPAFPWIANPLLFLSWYFYKKKPERSFILSLMAFLLMISFLFVESIIDNEGGIKAKIISYKLGYWLWVVSSLIVILGSYLRKKLKEK